MNFYKNFNSDYICCGTVNLPWDTVDQDLASVQYDNTRTRAIVAGSDYNDSLSEATKQYAEYGYTEYNTKIWKTTNLEPKLTFSWEQELANQLPLDHAVATVTRQDPGQILPWHEDRFYMLRRLHPEDTRPIWRFLLFLKDWKLGHVLQVNNSWLSNWKRGEVYAWQPSTKHISANIGLETKWTCNITGFLTI